MVGLVRIAVASAALAAILVTAITPPRAASGTGRLIVEFEPTVPQASLGLPRVVPAAGVSADPL